MNTLIVCKLQDCTEASGNLKLELKYDWLKACFVINIFLLEIPYYVQKYNLLILPITAMCLFFYPPTSLYFKYSVSNLLCKIQTYYSCEINTNTTILVKMISFLKIFSFYFFDDPNHIIC